MLRKIPDNLSAWRGRSALAEWVLPAERLRQIQELIRTHQVVRVDELSRLLGVSEVTVRRDLKTMERRGLLERTRGGALATHRIRVEPRFLEATTTHTAEKQAIGRAAAQLVQPGDTVFMTGGTTTQQVYRQISAPDVTVVTNHVGIAADLESGGADIDLILLGGHYRARSRSLVGVPAADTLRHFFSSRSFIGVDGLSAQDGLTAPSLGEAEMARLMIERTRGDVIVVADHSKLGAVADFVIADISHVDVLVVDDGIGAEHRRRLQEAGVKIMVASTSPTNHAAARPAQPG
jgi:DeoR family transcriptional regulator, fructose operon transcriptional repressor